MRKRRAYQIQLECGHIRSAFSKDGKNYYCVEYDALCDGEVIGSDYRTETTIQDKPSCLVN